MSYLQKKAEEIKEVYRVHRKRRAVYLMEERIHTIPQYWDNAYITKKMADEANGALSEDMQWQSQVGQDFFIYHILKKKKTGFFLDVGANDPIKINNTYALEKRGWEGLAIEPQEVFSAEWKEKRRTKCLPVIVGREDKEVDFFESNTNVLSGVAGYADKTEGAVCRKRQRTLKGILTEYGITHIDYMSLDVEGYEIEALSGIDFSKVQIDYISIENTKDLKEKQQFRKYMESLGYVWLAKIMWDDIWVRKSEK